MVEDACEGEGEEEGESEGECPPIHSEKRRERRWKRHGQRDGIHRTRARKRDVCRESRRTTHVYVLHTEL